MRANVDGSRFLLTVVTLAIRSMAGARGSRELLALAAVFVGCLSVSPVQAQSDVSGYLARARELERAFKYREAVSLLSKAIEMYPRCFYFVQRGMDRQFLGEYDAAISDFSEAIRRDAKYPTAYLALARILATCPEPRYRDGEKAVQIAHKNFDLTGGKFSSTYDALASAYAEIEDFDRARAWEEKAIEVASTEGEKSSYRERLQLYEQNRPYRQARRSPQ
jgi:tetratricopeptide (TPR) repeat protein